MDHNKSSEIVKGTTCFKEHEKRSLACEKTECRHWIHYEDCYNCTILASDKQKHTLQEIGDLFGITRMRICQIEKSILQKLLKNRDVKSTKQ
tara:strand:+ start:19162 stop:19437 length:276 start_codon:yes stop_codon:yes gene_type:complete